jgi:cation:H+ antiporter
MEQFIHGLLSDIATPVLFAIVIVMFFTLSKGADILVEEAVTLSIRWRVSKIIIGATVVSLGTTLPEASVSVLAAINGNPDLALGNAVGSIICDTGLILGIAAMMSPLPLNKKVINKQGTIQFLSGLLLVMATLPFSDLARIGTVDGHLNQLWGFAFIGLLVLYILRTIKWGKSAVGDIVEEIELDDSSNIIVVLKVLMGIAIVILSSKLLIPSVEIMAVRVGIPQSIIAATLVAFGTSLPELVTSITAVRRGHGELAIGNVIGADILNVLFVVGVASSVTPSGLAVPIYFYKLQFPVMIGVLGVFKLFTIFSKKEISRVQGGILFTIYLAYTFYSYFGFKI